MPFTTTVTVNILESEVVVSVVSKVTEVDAVVTEASSSNIAEMVVSSVILVKEPSQPTNLLPSTTGSAG